MCRGKRKDKRRREDSEIRVPEAEGDSSGPSSPQTLRILALVPAGSICLCLKGHCLAAKVNSVPEHYSVMLENECLPVAAFTGLIGTGVYKSPSLTACDEF